MAKKLKKVLKGVTTLRYRVKSTMMREPFVNPLAEIEIELVNEEDGIVVDLGRYTMDETTSFELPFEGKTEELVD